MMVTAEKLRNLLSLHGTVRPQTSSEWNGPFPIPPSIERFYLEIGPTDIEIKTYGNPFFLPSLARLWQFQAGYSWNGLSGEPIEDRNEEWIVVADEGGDPFIFVRSSGAVLHAYHGKGDWDASRLFPDLNAMSASLAELGAIALDAGTEFLDEDCLIRAKFRALAVDRLTKLIGSASDAQSILRTLDWV